MRALFLGAIVNVFTLDEVDGQHLHAAIVTHLGDDDVADVSIFRATESGVLHVGPLSYDDTDVPETDCWFWPAETDVAEAEPAAPAATPAPTRTSRQAAAQPPATEG